MHDDLKDKDFKLELSWIGCQTDGYHQSVPEELYNRANEAGKSIKETGSSDDDDA